MMYLDKRIKQSLVILTLISTLYLNCDNTTSPHPPVIKTSKIVYNSIFDGSSDIFSIDPDGDNKIRLTNNPGYDYAPIWSPDASKIVFCSDRDGHDQIYIMNADGSDQERLTFTSEAYAEDQYPEWSPDGTKIIFTSFRDNKSWDIYTINIDGTGLTRITDTVENENKPEFFPDGNKILFTVVLGDYGTYEMNLNGSNRKRINEAGFSGNLSPDGTRVTYEGFSGLYIMDSDGTNIIELTNDKFARWPTFSPDGKKIVYTNKVETEVHLFIINSDGTGNTQLTFGPQKDFSGDWSPYIEK